MKKIISIIPRCHLFLLELCRTGRLYGGFVFLSFVFLLLSFSGSVLAQEKSWFFESWDSDITIHEDSTMTIIETHEVNFTGSFSWINRDLPKTKGIWYKFKSVKDQYGKDYSYTLDNTVSMLSVTANYKAQDETKTFVYEYDIYNAIGDFEKYDELYWNVVSSDRDVEIVKATATIHLPKESKTDDLKQKIFVGTFGSTDEVRTYEIIDNKTLKFSHSNIASNEDFTIVGGWTDRLFDIQTYFETPWKQFWFYFKWIWWFSPFLLLVFMIFRYLRFGKDPAGRGSIPPEFEPPDKLRPAEIGVLMDENVDLKDITSTIVDLAVRGYLEIHEEEKKKFLAIGSGKTYRFKRTDKSDQDLLQYEKELLASLFHTKNEVKLDDLKDKFYTHIKDINKALYEEVVDKKRFFPRRPDHIRWIYIGIAIALFMFASFLGFLIWPLALIIHGVIILAFAWAMPKKTKEGVLAMEKSKGFKLFLSKTETEKMKLIDHPKWFEQYLPYAMIYGVEKQWAKKFESIYKESPNWYHGYTAGAFSSTAFASDFSRGMNSTVGGTLASNPSSGGGGFGGGGGAGGGGGGGGSGAG
ncbi:MAG: DUF2207 domain-containing protein [bacterium]